jgi:hypothetical protein
MSYLVDNTEYGEDSEKKTRQEKQGVQTTSGTVGGSQVGQPVSQQGSTAKSVPGASGQYTDIQKYIEANKPKTQQLQQKIGQKFQKEGEKVQKSLQEGGSQYEKYLGAQSLLGQEGKRLEDAESFTSGLLGKTGTYQQPAQQTTQQESTNILDKKDQYYQPTEEETQKFSQYRTGWTPDQLTNLGYQAPTFAQEKKQVQDLEKQAKALYTRDATSKMGALSELAKGNDYTAGEQTLDRALITGTASPYLTRQSLAPTTEATKQALEDLTGQIGETREFQEEERTRIAEETGKKLSDAFSGLQAKVDNSEKYYQGNIEGKLYEYPDGSEVYVPGALDQIKESIANGEVLSPDQMKELMGFDIPDEDFRQFYDLYSRSLPYTLQEKLQRGMGGELTESDIQTLSQIHNIDPETLKQVISSGERVRTGERSIYTDFLITDQYLNDIARNSSYTCGTWEGYQKNIINNVESINKLDVNGKNVPIMAYSYLQAPNECAYQKSINCADNTMNGTTVFSRPPLKPAPDPFVDLEGYKTAVQTGFVLNFLHDGTIEYGYNNPQRMQGIDPNTGALICVPIPVMQKNIIDATLSDPQYAFIQDGDYGLPEISHIVNRYFKPNNQDPNSTVREIESFNINIGSGNPSPPDYRTITTTEAIQKYYPNLHSIWDPSTNKLDFTKINRNNLTQQEARLLLTTRKLPDFSNIRSAESDRYTSRVTTDIYTRSPETYQSMYTSGLSDEDKYLRSGDTRYDISGSVAAPDITDYQAMTEQDFLRNIALQDLAGDYRQYTTCSDYYKDISTVQETDPLTGEVTETQVTPYELGQMLEDYEIAQAAGNQDAFFTGRDQGPQITEQEYNDLMANLRAKYLSELAQFGHYSGEYNPDGSVRTIQSLE